MATITLNNTTYNVAKSFADTQNQSVDDFVVMLINNFAQGMRNKKKFEMQPIEKLSPEIQEILNMPRTGEIDAKDINGENARMEYYKEKYAL